MKTSQSEFIVDGGEQANGLPTSKSTLGTTTNGKHDTIAEEK